MICRCGVQCTCDKPIKMPPKPNLPDMSIRGYGNVSLGRHMADHQKHTNTRDVIWRKWLEEVEESPEDYSPIVIYTPVSQEYVGRKLEMRWSVEDEDTKLCHLHCFEGEILQIIPYTASRPTYDDFRSCKHDVALVKWDPEFDMADSHVPLKPDLYAQENKHCGWNLVRDEFAAFVCTQLAQCAVLEQQQTKKSD